MSYTPPYTPMDLEQHIKHAFRYHLSQRSPSIVFDYSAPVWSSMVDGIADGVANWMMQRDNYMIEQLAGRLVDMPYELLERASVMLAEAALVAAKKPA